MKTRTITFTTKFSVGDKVIGLGDGKICRGTVEEIFVKLDKSRIDSVYTTCYHPEVEVEYRLKITDGQFATVDLFSESFLASSLDEFPIYGN